MLSSTVTAAALIQVLHSISIGGRENCLRLGVAGYCWVAGVGGTSGLEVSWSDGQADTMVASTRMFKQLDEHARQTSFQQSPVAHLKNKRLHARCTPRNLARRWALRQTCM